MKAQEVMSVHFTYVRMSLYFISIFSVKCYFSEQKYMQYIFIWKCCINKTFFVVSVLININ